MRSDRRNRTAGAALAIAMAMALGGPAMAEDWVAGNSGACPEEVDGRSFQDIVEGAALPVVAPSATLFQTSNRIIPIDGDALEFGRRVERLATSEFDDSTILVKARRDGAVRCGWMVRSELLPSIDAMKVTDLPGHEDDVGPGGEPSELLAYIVARSSRDEQNRLQPVPVFIWPSSETEDGAFRYARAEPLSYFSVANVMDVRRDMSDAGRQAVTGPASHPSGCIDINDQNCFILLAGTSAAGGAALLGWVRGSDVELWPSSLSIYFAEGEEGVPYYFDECSPHHGVTRRDCRIPERLRKADGSPKAGIGKHIPVAGNNIPRMPIISVSPGRAVDDGRQIYAYEAVSALAVCRPGADDIVCRENVDALKRAGAEAIKLETLRNVDVLFVIDGTGSMDKYFEPVVRAAVAFADDIADDGIRARFSALVYGDYDAETGDTASVSLYKVADFGGVGETEVLRPLLDARAIQDRIADAQKDQPEAPFAAIAKAVEDGYLNWSDEAGLRLIIWIGDVGNRDPGENATRGPTGKLMETLSAETVAEAIQGARFEGGTNIRIAAIHVPSRQERFREANRVDFLTDYEALRQALRKAGISNYNPREAGLSETDAEAEVRRALDAVKTAIEDGESAYRCARGVTICEAPDAVPADRAVEGGADVVPTNPIGEELARELGLLTDGAADGDGEVIAVERVYMRYDPADPDYEFWLGLKRPELDKLIDGVRDLCSAMESFAYRRELAGAYRSVLSAAIRERVVLADISPQEFMAKQLSVPKANFSHMLDLPFEKAAGVFETDEAAANRLQASVCTRFVVLNNVRNGKRVSLDDFEFVEGDVVPKPGVDLDAPDRAFRWDWSGDGGGNRFYFFPLSFVP